MPLPPLFLTSQGLFYVYIQFLLFLLGWDLCFAFRVWRTFHAIGKASKFLLSSLAPIQVNYSMQYPFLYACFPASKYRETSGNGRNMGMPDESFREAFLQIRYIWKFGIMESASEKRACLNHVILEVGGEMRNRVIPKLGFGEQNMLVSARYPNSEVQ